MVLATRAALTAATIHPMVINAIYLNFAPAYRHITSHASPRTSTVPRSGINKNTRNMTLLTTKKFIKNSLVLVILYFLMSQLARNKTYHILKNSAGWRVESPGMDIHHLAPLNTTPIHGTNTSS
jgi:hypothetical protein